MADWYARFIDSLADIYLGPFCRKVVKAFPGPARILDIGTGAGQLPILLARANPECRVVGIDLSEDYLAIGRAKARSAGVDDRVAYLLVNLERDDWQPEPFDLVVSTCSLHHWRWPARILSAAGRVLSPGGQIWILDDARDASWRARREWVRRVRAVSGAGLGFAAAFYLECRFLAYSRAEIERLCFRTGLRLLDWTIDGVFFTARIGRRDGQPAV